jgi:hypothetical protein
MDCDTNKEEIKNYQKNLAVSMLRAMVLKQGGKISAWDEGSCVF